MASASPISRKVKQARMFLSKRSFFVSITQLDRGSRTATRPCFQSVGRRGAAAIEHRLSLFVPENLL